MAKIKWSDIAIKSYKETGEQLKGIGCKALREVKDSDCSTVLTFWAAPEGCVIQQTWTDTGDVVLYRAIDNAELAGMFAAS